MADEMIVFSKSLDFLREEKFINTVNDAIGEEEDSYKKAQSARIDKKNAFGYCGKRDLASS